MLKPTLYLKNTKLYKELENFHNKVVYFWHHHILQLLTHFNLGDNP